MFCRCFGYYIYPKQLLSQKWVIKSCKDRQKLTWSRTIHDIFHSLSLDKGEITKGRWPLCI